MATYSLFVLDISNVAIEKFIDKFINCNIPDDVVDIVQEVQTHSRNHSKSCKKNNKTCHFNFPRPPSLRTFLCAPPNDLPENSAELKCQAKKHLENLWATLDCTPITDDITTEYIFQKAGITQQIFENSMNLLSKKPTVILKREPQHCWINQYNSTLIKAWNANKDIQYVTDAYSCIKYILSYISKKESEESDLLKCAREAREGNQDAVDELKRLGHFSLIVK